MMLLGGASRSCHKDSDEYLEVELGVVSEKMVSDSERIAETCEEGDVESRE